MKIEILHLLEGAKQARGLTVIIDVFRAFRTACYIAEKNPAAIIPVSSVEEALKLRSKFEDVVVIGEVQGKQVDGFDFGNSPAHIQNYDFAGKTVIHRSSSGTQGLVFSNKADEVITGSFVNAKAIARYIKQKNPGTVSLVCMGWACEYESEEDTFCAEYIKSLLEGISYPVQERIEQLKKTDGKRFFLPENRKSEPEEDFYLSTTLNKFKFVLKVKSLDDTLIQLEKIEV